MAKDNTIKIRVMQVVNSKIDNAQKEYNEECHKLETKLHNDKVDLATKKVEEIVGKIME